MERKTLKLDSALAQALKEKLAIDNSQTHPSQPSTPTQQAKPHRKTPPLKTEPKTEERPQKHFPFSLAEVQETLAWLKTHYPQAFTSDQFQPLTKGIEATIWDTLKNKEAWPRTRLKATLKFYVSHPRYLQATLEGTCRITLQGEAAEVITESEKQFAKEKLKKQAESKNKKRLSFKKK